MQVNLKLDKKQIILQLFNALSTVSKRVDLADIQGKLLEILSSPFEHQENYSTLATATSKTISPWLITSYKNIRYEKHDGTTQITYRNDNNPIFTDHTIKKAREINILFHDMIPVNHTIIFNITSNDLIDAFKNEDLEFHIFIRILDLNKVDSKLLFDLNDNCKFKFDITRPFQNKKVLKLEQKKLRFQGKYSFPLLNKQLINHSPITEMFYDKFTEQELLDFIKSCNKVEINNIITEKHGKTHGKIIQIFKKTTLDSTVIPTNSKHINEFYQTYHNLKGTLILLEPLISIIGPTLVKEKCFEMVKNGSIHEVLSATRLLVQINCITSLVIERLFHLTILLDRENHLLLPDVLNLSSQSLLIQQYIVSEEELRFYFDTFRKYYSNQSVFTFIDEVVDTILNINCCRFNTAEYISMLRTISLIVSKSSRSAVLWLSQITRENTRIANISELWIK